MSKVEQTRKKILSNIQKPVDILNKNLDIREAVCKHEEKKVNTWIIADPGDMPYDQVKDLLETCRNNKVNVPSVEEFMKMRIDIRENRYFGVYVPGIIWSVKRDDLISTTAEFIRFQGEEKWHNRTDLIMNNSKVDKIFSMIKLFPSSTTFLQLINGITSLIDSLLSRIDDDDQFFYNGITVRTSFDIGFRKKWFPILDLTLEM